MYPLFLIQTFLPACVNTIFLISQWRERAREGRDRESDREREFFVCLIYFIQTIFFSSKSYNPTPDPTIGQHHWQRQYLFFRWKGASSLGNRIGCSLTVDCPRVPTQVFCSLILNWSVPNYVGEEKVRETTCSKGFCSGALNWPLRANQVITKCRSSIDE